MTVKQQAIDLALLLVKENITEHCAIEVGNVFQNLIAFHQAKANLESQGYLVRSDGNGDFDLHDMNTHQVVKWHYDFDTGVFTLIVTPNILDGIEIASDNFETEIDTPFGKLTLHNHPLFNHGQDKSNGHTDLNQQTAATTSLFPLKL